MAVTVALLALLLFALPANAQWQTPVNLGANVNSASDEFRAALSPDGQTLIFDSDRAGGLGGFDLYQSTDSGGSWGAASSLGSGVNTAARDYAPALSADGLTLYLVTSSWDIAQSQWTGSAWGARTSVPGSVNSGAQEWAPFLSADGSKMYFTAWNRGGGAGGHDIWVSSWNGSSWGTPAGVGASVNSSGNEYTGSVTADGLTMYLSIDGDIHVSAYSGGVWQTPVPVGGSVNAPDRWDTNPLISPDGTKLYFSSDRDGGYGGYDLYVSTFGGVDVPIVGLPSQAVLANRLLAPEPNPFGAATSLRFELRDRSPVSIQVYDVRGRIVATLADGEWEAGRHSVAWNGRNDDGTPVASGVYFARMQSVAFREVQRLVLLH